MQVFLTILVISVLALVTTSRRLYGLRRRRPVIVLIAGGWVGVLVGVAIGPSGGRLIASDNLDLLTPLLLAGLGWVGMMVGLQVRREVLSALPRTVKGLALTDAAASGLVVGAIGLAGLGYWFEFVGAAWIAGPLVLLMACSIGWSMETRSLGVGDDAGSQRAALMIRAAGALCTVVAVAAFGVLASVAVRDGEGGMRLDPWGGTLRVLVSVGLALTTGVLGRYCLRLAGRSRADQLVVFLGMVAWVAGIAIQMRVSPLFAAMLVGIVIANLKGVDARQFERFILRAEHIIAALMALLAGVLLSTGIGVVEVALAVAIAAARLALKPGVFRWWLRRSEVEEPSGALAEERRTPLAIGPVRQSPLAISLAVGFVLLDDRSVLSTRLLSVVVMAGFLSDLIPLWTSIARHGIRRVPRERAGAGERGDGGEGVVA